MTNKDVTANGKPLRKIKLGCIKNIHNAKIVDVNIAAYDHPGNCLPNRKKSTGETIFFSFLKPT